MRNESVCGHASFWEEALADWYTRRFGHQMTDRQLECVIEAARDVASSARLAIEDYVSLLRSLPIDSPLVQSLLAASTNKESYFFRDQHTTASLREIVLPELVERKRGTRMLRVWSAGCSTGEEIYTLSILLQEVIPDWDRWSVTLVATDIDMRAMAFARRAEYREWSLRATSDIHRQMYFEYNTQTGGYLLRDKYRRPVRFSVLNLAEPTASTPEPGQFDLILCRNVSIYFSSDARKHLEERIRASLAPLGVWITGSSDPGPTGGFGVRVLPGMLAYTLEQAPNHSSVPIHSQTATTMRPPRPPSTPLAPALQPAPSKARRVSAVEKKKPAEPVVVMERSDDRLRSMLNEARELADREELKLALERVDEALELNPISSEAYLLRALIHDCAGDSAAAVGDLRRHLYLDPSSAEGHLRLGLLLSRLNQNAEAIRSMRNAMVAAANSKDSATHDVLTLAGEHLARLLEFNHV